MPPDITRSYVRHSLQRVSKQPLHAKRGCGTKTQDSKEGMNIYTVMTVKNIDTGNSQNRNAKTGKYVYNTHIYIRQPSHRSIRKERKRLSRITETTVSWLRKGCLTTRKRLFGTSEQPFSRLRIRLLSTRVNVYACMTASYLTSPKPAYLSQHIIYIAYRRVSES